MEIRLFIVLLFTMSCHGTTKSDNSNDEDNADAPRVIRFKNLPDTSLKMEDIIKKIELVPLETTTSSLIGQIDKLLLSDNHIFILDSTVEKCVFIFDRFGKFANKICPTGGGPNEIGFLGDFDIDNEGNIYLLDLRSAKVNKYDLMGNFLNGFSFGFQTARFAHLENENFIFDQHFRKNNQSKRFGKDINCNLILVNNSEQTLKTYIPYEEKFELYKNLNPTYKNIYRSKKGLYYVRPYFNVIYSIGKYDSISPEYNIDFGDYDLPDEFIRNNASEENPGLLKQSIANEEVGHRVSGFYEIDDLITFNFRIKKDRYWAVYSKKTKAVRTINISKLKITEMPIALFPSVVVNNRLVSVWDDFTYLSYGDRVKNLKGSNYEALLNIKEGSNPILIFTTIKTGGVYM